MIQGQATYFGGRSEEYAEALKYTPPALNTTSALTRQLVADDATFDRFLVTRPGPWGPSPSAAAT